MEEISDSLLQQQAVTINDTMHCDRSFKATRLWLRGFKERYHINENKTNDPTIPSSTHDPSQYLSMKTNSQETTTNRKKDTKELFTQDSMEIMGMMKNMEKKILQLENLLTLRMNHIECKLATFQNQVNTKFDQLDRT